MVTRHGKLVFVTSHPEGLQFPRELLDREPETIEWIDSFQAPCSFWDIGANVGTYSLYAALRPGVSVLAFEPAPATYASLCRNIEANGSGERIEALCIALSDTTRIGTLNMSATNAGNSFNSFESTEDCFGRQLDIRFRQAAVGFTVDDFRRSFGIAPPNYLKIDVDGIEQQILDGAAETLADPALGSVLIELESEETERNARLIARLEHAGFVLAQRGANHAGSANAIFTRTIKPSPHGRGGTAREPRGG
jgi:FkbM family methyltransferase